MTRGRADNLALVVTDEATLEAARDVLESALALDRADVPAVRHRRDVQTEYFSRSAGALAMRRESRSHGLSL